MAGEIFFLAKNSEKSTRNGGQSTRFVGNNYSGKYNVDTINQHILLYYNLYGGDGDGADGDC